MKNRDFKKSLVYWKRYLYLVPEDETALSEISLLIAVIKDREEPQIILNDFSETNILTIEDTADPDTEDSDSDETSLSYYTLSGKITDNAALKTITINDEEIEIDEKTEVQIDYEIGLSKGENNIKIYAEDIKGYKVEKIVKVIYGAKKAKPIEVPIEVPTEVPTEESEEEPIEDDSTNSSGTNSTNSSGTN